MPVKSLRVQTPAKINLALRVLGARQDGYHDLETLFQAIDLYDQLILEESDSQSTLEVPGFPELESDHNLVVRAVRWIQTHTGRDLRVRMKLIKSVPVAGGLGGGSSNAAAALKGVSHLFDLDLSDADLARGALALGADVPFFLVGGTAVGEGVGERLTPVELPLDYALILVNPGFPVSTAAIFREFSKSLTGKAREGRLWMRIREGRPVEDLLENDLQTVAERMHPEIRRVREVMERAGMGTTLMSGSGPTMFALVRNSSAEALAKELPPPWRVFPARPVARGLLID
jgi:4-diphosphocytidyl-2-C-methyl-D-erythritol kinase